MKLSNRSLLNSINVLTKLNQLELPIKVAFIILKNTKAVERELTNYFEAREKLVKQYAVLNEEGQAVPDEYGNLQFKDECVGKWNSDINELLDLEVSIDLQTISIDDLFRADLSMTPTELSSIEFMIKD